MCKQNACISFDWTPEDYPPDPDGNRRKAITVKRSAPRPDAPFIDSTAFNDEQALLEKLRRQMQQSQEEQCGNDLACVCIREEGVKPTEKRFVVPLTTTYLNLSNNTKTYVVGSVRILKSEYPGECFANALVALLTEPDILEIDLGGIVATIPPDPALPIG